MQLTQSLSDKGTLASHINAYVSVVSVICLFPAGSLEVNSLVSRVLLWYSVLYYTLQ